LYKGHILQMTINKL